MDEKEKVSVRGKVWRRVIKRAASDPFIGSKIKDGTYRKKMREIPWHCPKGYSHLRIGLSKSEIEVLTPPEVKSEKIIYLLHGGGYVGKLKNAYRDFARKYSDMRGGMKVYLSDYRVAPENPYPAALLDAYEGYCFLQSIGYCSEQIIVAGDSAGGGLALALCTFLREKGRKLPRALVLMSPWTDLTCSGESYRTNFEKDPLFGNTKNSMIYSGEYYGKQNPANPLISPKFSDFHGFPEMLFQAGSIEMLLSDTTDVVRLARASGCKVKETVYTGMFHLFQMAFQLIPESVAAWEEVEEFINELV